MKVILYMATSLDGFIAKLDGDSDWVSEVDSVEFEKQIISAGCLIVGRNTFDQYYGDIYPVQKILNVVMTHNSKLKAKDKNVLYSIKSPRKTVEMLKSKGFKKVILIGGGTTNSSYLKDNLIDEIYLSIHPLLLGTGIPIFRNAPNVLKKLSLIEVKKLKEGLVQLHYKVK